MPFVDGGFFDSLGFGMEPGPGYLDPIRDKARAQAQSNLGVWLAQIASGPGNGSFDNGVANFAFHHGTQGAFVGGNPVSLKGKANPMMASILIVS